MQTYSFKFLTMCNLAHDRKTQLIIHFKVYGFGYDLENCSLNKKNVGKMFFKCSLTPQKRKMLFFIIMIY
jgi:hypothetical protein